MALYKDYFGIRPDYAPCMTLADINKTPDTWLGFYPHDSFVEIFRELLRSLEGGNKTLWITGAYGTGKSHASLVLQKLFMDDEARVLRWLALRTAQIPEPVRKSLLLRRGGKALVVYDVNADGVDAKNQFLMRLQRGIMKALCFSPANLSPPCHASFPLVARNEYRTSPFDVPHRQIAS